MRLLVVEDDKTLNKQIVTALEQAGYAVDTAFDGEEGQFLGDTEPYDAILLDLGLPKVDGVSVLTAWRRLDDVPHGDVDARVWLYATARRVLANQRRSSRRRHALHDRLALEASAGVSDGAPAGEVALVRDALDRLGPRDREILLLAEWEGLSPAEIASVLGCLTVTARGRLHRARRRFRGAFEEALDGHDRRAARGVGHDYSLIRQGGS